MANMHTATRIFIVIGLILLLILGFWGIVVIATHIPSVFAAIGHLVSAPFNSLFSRAGSIPSSAATSTATGYPTAPGGGDISQGKEQLAVSAPSAVIVSGLRFTLSWTHTLPSGAPAQGEYSYELSYSCAPGLSIDAPLSTGSYRAVACNTPFNYTNAAARMTLVPHVSGSQNISTQFTVSAVQLSNNYTTTSGNASVSFAPGARTATISAPPQSGIVDLSVRILSANSGGAQFEIANIGTRSAPAGWIFTALLPPTSHLYVSAPQQTLGPGGHVVYNLNWSMPAQNCPTYQTYPYGYPSGSQNCGAQYGYTGVFTVTADAQDVTRDGNHTNNTASAAIYY